MSFASTCFLRAPYAALTDCAPPVYAIRTPQATSSNLDAPARRVNPNNDGVMFEASVAPKSRAVPVQTRAYAGLSDSTPLSLDSTLTDLTEANITSTSLNSTSCQAGSKRACPTEETLSDDTKSKRVVYLRCLLRKEGGLESERTTRPSGRGISMTTLIIES